MKCNEIGCGREALAEVGEFSGLRMCATHALIEARRANEGYLRERNTWARQMADLRDERDAAIAEAEKARSNAAQTENDLLAALTNVEAEVEPLRQQAAEAEWLLRMCENARDRAEGQVEAVEALAEKLAATPDRHMSHRNVAQSIRTALTQGGAS